LAFFTQNPLERTEFKTAFCGIDEYYHKDIFYSLSGINQLRIAFYYARRFMANPAYINSSLLDSMFGFFSYYMIPKDFITLFNYIPWREEEIVPLLIQEYDWETAGDTRSTWRIGDGTAAFYNYIYYTMSGFSEYDTFRSNQIREGMINRSEALLLVENENLPAFDAIQWYCRMIGIDFVEALRVINAAPKCYPFGI
jgi:glutamine---fructose-6-phosphate transaminase (isomerizing)